MMKVFLSRALILLSLHGMACVMHKDPLFLSEGRRDIVSKADLILSGTVTKSKPLKEWTSEKFGKLQYHSSEIEVVEVFRGKTTGRLIEVGQWLKKDPWEDPLWEKQFPQPGEESVWFLIGDGHNWRAANDLYSSRTLTCGGRSRFDSSHPVALRVASAMLSYGGACTEDQYAEFLNVAVSKAARMFGVSVTMKAFNREIEQLKGPELKTVCRVANTYCLFGHKCVEQFEGSVVKSSAIQEFTKDSARTWLLLALAAEQHEGFTKEVLNTALDDLGEMIRVAPSRNAAQLDATFRNLVRNRETLVREFLSSSSVAEALSNRGAGSR